MFYNGIKIIEKCLFGIVTKGKIDDINIREWMGTGFAITEKHILTNAHLCYSEKNFKGNMQTEFLLIEDSKIGTPLIRAKLLAWNNKWDMALMEINDTKNYNQNPAVLKEKNTKPGEIVGTLGYPLNFVEDKPRKYIFQKRFKGAFVSIYRNEFLMETDQEMYPGSSGSPLFNKKGQIVGIHHSTKNNDNNRVDISLNKPTEIIQKFLDELKFEVDYKKVR